jgi:hypothetical protein
MDSYTSITVGKQLLGIGNKFREDMDEFLYVNYNFWGVWTEFSGFMDEDYILRNNSVGV